MCRCVSCCPRCSRYVWTTQERVREGRVRSSELLQEDRSRQVFGDGEKAGEEANAKEVEDVLEHLAIMVDELVLLEAVEDDRHAAVQHLD